MLAAGHYAKCGAHLRTGLQAAVQLAPPCSGPQSVWWGHRWHVDEVRGQGSELFYLALGSRPSKFFFFFFDLGNW